MRTLLFLFFVTFLCTAKEHVPIVLVHGVMSDDLGMAPTEHYIRKHMGDEVYVKNIELGFGKVTSLANVFHQAQHLRRDIQADPKLKNGFNFVVHSQGGLVSRYYLQHYNDPPVHTYISWGSPQQGVYGLPGKLDIKFKWLDYLEMFSHHVLYSSFCQHYIGFAGYWHDTLHYYTYLNKCCFLPYLNNHKSHENSKKYKENICSLKNMVLVMSTEEDIVEPRISCHFGFYKPGSKTEIQELYETDLYKQDLLGLRTLHETGRLHLRIAHCTHAQFQEDETSFLENTLEFLKADPDNAPHTEPGARLMQARA